MKKIDKRYTLAGIVVILALSLIASYKLISGNGLIFYGDLRTALFLDRLGNLYYPLWDQYGSESNLVRLTKIPYRYPFFILGSLFGIQIEAVMKLMIVGTLFLAGCSMFLAEGWIIRSLNKDYSSKLILSASLTSAIIYMFNPWSMRRIHQISLWFGYAITPLVLLFFIIALRTKKLKHILFAAILLAFASTTPHFFVFNFLLMVCWMVYSGIIEKGNTKTTIWGNVKILSAIILFWIVFNSYWILPYIITSFSQPLAPGYILTEEVINLLSRNSETINVFRLLDHWGAFGFMENPQPDSPILRLPWLIASFMLPIAAFAALLLRPRNKYVLYFSIVAIAILFLGTGTKELFPSFYSWLVFDAPLLSKFGWVIRGPNKLGGLLALAYSFLIGITIIELLTNKVSKKIKKSFAPIILLIIISAFVLYSGPHVAEFMGDRYLPTEIPKEIYTINDWLSNQNNDLKVSWAVPHKLGSLESLSSAKPNIGPHTPFSSFYWAYINQLLLSGRTSHFDKYLGILGSRYYLCHDETDLEYGLENLMGQKDLELVKQEESIYVFENKDYAQHIFVPSQNFFVMGGLDILTSLNSIEVFSSSNSTLTLLDQKLYETNLLNHARVSDGIILDKRLEDQALSFIDNGRVIAPFAATNHHNPSKLWSKAGATDPLHGSWHPYLKKMDIENWNFDYGKGLVFTWSPSVLEDPSALKEGDLLARFDFEDGLGEWNNNEKDMQNMSLSNLAHQGKHSLGVELYNSTQSGKVISSPLVTAEYGSQYRWEFYAKGKDAHNIHAWISKHDASGNRIMRYHMKEIGNGNFDWKKVSLDFPVNSEDTTYIRLNIVHGSETDKPLPNKVWVDDVSVYDLRDYLKPNTLEIPFNVDKTNNYKLFIRYFKNQEGGGIKVHLDSERITINTKDQLNRFIWEDLGTYQLVNGGHTLVLENVKGFNAVNIFALIPEEDHRNFKQEMTEVMQNKTIIYLFEAESDMYHDNATISKKFGGEASNGEVLELAAGKAWQEIEILKNGTYSLAIRAKGDFRVQIADKEFEFQNSNLTYWYSPTFELNRGEYNLTITPSGTPMANFSFELVSNIETEIIERLPAGIVSFSTDSYSGDSSLEVTSNVSEEGWLWLYTPEVSVTPGKRYSAITHMKYRNVVESYISIEGYNKTSEDWIELMQVPSGQTGTSDWEEYRQMLTIPEDITNIRFVLSAGWINDQEVGNATTWFDDISVCPVKDYLDVIWLYTTKNNETLNELFKTNETPASIMEYTKIDPTKYKVKVNATEPFMLSFAESYDPLWEARVYKDGVKVEVVKSIPLYSVINGFWIDETGNLEIEIRYKPQEWFVLGLWISVTTFIGCIGYLFYDWRRGKGGKWALRIEARRHNAGNVVNKGFRERVRRLKKKLRRKN